jgi:spermidine synthase
VMAAKNPAGNSWLGPTALLLIMAGQVAAVAEEKILEVRESPYNSIFIRQYGDIISMNFGYNKTIYTESEFYRLDDSVLPVVYTQFMTAGLMYAAATRNILEIGFGGGRTSWYLHRFLPQATVLSVELDPVVLELARKYFGIKDEPGFGVTNEDGRIFLSRSQEKYDIILIDAYRGPFVPFHLLTKEFYALVKAHLAEGGVVVQNIEPSTMLFDSAVKTIGAVFSQLDFYPADGNIVTVAYDFARPIEQLSATASERDKTLNLKYPLAAMLAERRVLRAEPQVIDASAKILTDDFAPVESLKAIENHNRKWQ